MQQNLLNIYCIPRLDDVEWIPMLNPIFGVKKTNTLFQHIDPKEYEGICTFVDRPEDADYFLVPHNYARIARNDAYIKKCEEIARTYSKTLLLFAYQDSAAPIHVQRAIVFRSSQYKKDKAAHEIIMPAFVEDLGAQYGVSPKKKSEIPSVGFVGKAGFESFSHRLSFFIKNTFLRQHPYKDGVYYRRKALRALEHSPKVTSRCIIRSSYSGNVKSIPLDPAQARREYIQNSIESDITLAPKGDGNYSLRFYETLSLGRIPLLIDTDCLLPLEDRVMYDDVIIRVPYTDIERLPDVVSATYASWSEEEYEQRQWRARQLFETYLYMPMFLKTVFTVEFLAQITPYESEH